MPDASTDEPIRVAIVDDDVEAREAIAWIIDHSDGFESVGCFSTCAEVLGAAASAAPDVVLMDIGLGAESGITCVGGLKAAYPQIEVLMLTVFSDDEKIFQSLRAGAVGYLLKKTSAPRLLDAIRDVRLGGSPMSGEVARRVLGHFHDQRLTTHGADLSSREEDVLHALIEGHSYKAIADRLFVSVHTVRFHLHNIYKKLHVSTRAEAVAKATSARGR